jgi:NTE family protein
VTADPIGLARLLPAPTAYVLGGGGSYGAVQLGMLRALAATDLSPDLVIGTSVGSVNGAVLAADPTRAAGTLTRIWSQIDRKQVLPGNVVTSMIAARGGRSYLFDPGPLTELLSTYLPVRTIEELALRRSPLSRSTRAPVSRSVATATKGRASSSIVRTGR